MMSLESSGGSTCSKLSLSQDAFDYMWKSLDDLTEFGNYTQLATRDPAQCQTDLQFTLEDGNALLHIDKFQISRCGSAPNSQTSPADQLPFPVLEQLSSSPGILNTVISVVQPSDPIISAEQQSSVVARGSDFIAQHSPAQPSLPSNVPLLGEYDFRVSLGNQSKETKAVDWTYSETLRKVFVRHSASCPFLFSTSHPPPLGVMLRAMPIFSLPQHVQEPVKRCPRHMGNNVEGVPKDHLVCCEHKMARYDEDSLTKFRSVVIPYDHPPVGVEWVPQLYQFLCYSSCPGGLNRRPMQLIFSLETSDGQVIGRQAIEVRVCACPGRDRQSEESNVPRPVCKQEEKLAVTSEIMSIGPAPKRRKMNEEVFNISVCGRENYEILNRLRDSLEVASAIPRAQFEQLHRQQENARKSRPDVLTQLSSGTKNCQTRTGSDIPVASLIPGSPVLLAQCNRSPYGAVHAAGSNLSQPSRGTVLSWLAKHGLSECADAFNRQSLFYMAQLDNYTLDDFERLGLDDVKLGAVLLAFLRHRHYSDAAKKAMDTTSTNGSIADTHLIPTPGGSGDDGQSGGMYEVTRYTFRRLVSLPEQPRDENGS